MTKDIIEFAKFLAVLVAIFGGIRTIDVVAGFASGKIKTLIGLTDAGDDVRIKVETA